MDITRGLRIAVYGLGCGAAGATSIERVIKQAACQAGRPAEV